MTTQESTSNFAFWAVLSVASSVGIILVNKWIMQTYKFTFVFTLTTLHFLAQAILMEIMVFFRIITPGRLPFVDNVLTAACGVGSIVFMNYNLKFNSVGFYQMTKLMCIPLIVFIESRFYGKFFSGKIKFTLALVLLGVGITAVTDIQVNAIGLLFGALAVGATAQFQIWQGAKKDQHQVTPIQITHSVSFPMALICGTCAVFTEAAFTDNSVLNHQFASSNEVFLIILSCLCAISVNVCSFTLIGNSSPITYQVIGHMKTTLVLLGGLILFPFSGTLFRLMNNLGGIAVAMFGVILYGHLKTSSNGSDVLDKYLPKDLIEFIGKFDDDKIPYETVITAPREDVDLPSKQNVQV